MASTTALRRLAGAALAVVVGAAASWAVREYLGARRFRDLREQDREMLRTWENEGGNLAPAVARASPNATR